MKTHWTEVETVITANRIGKHHQTHNPTRLSLLAGILIVLGALALPLQAATYVNRVGTGGAIVEVTLNTTNWTAANSPYVIEAKLNVKDGETLTIGAGVTVTVNPNIGIYVAGTLNATQTTFTTNGNAGWLGIYLSPKSGASTLSGCTLSYAGSANIGSYNGGNRRAAIYIDKCGPTITDCTIANCGSHGIDMWPNGGTVQNTLFTNLPGTAYSIVYDAVAPFPKVSGLSAASTGIAGIWVARGTISDTNQWNYPGAGMVYYLDREINVAEGGKLIVDPGAIVKLTTGWFSVSGTLDARGTAALPIIFTSSGATPAAGDWFGFYFGPKAGDSTLDYATIAYAGRDNIGYFHSGYRKVSIYVDSCNPSFNHMTIMKSANDGIVMWASACSINNSTISGCAGYGLRAESNSLPNVSNTSFNGNGFGGSDYNTIGTDATSVPNPVNVTFNTNAYQGVKVWGGTLASSAQWKNWSDNAPYVVTGDVTVNTNVTLVIEQGATVKFQGTGLYVNGTLIANGDTNRITFTSWKDDTAGGDSNGNGSINAPAPGDWKGIYLSSASGDSVFNNCGFRYAGANYLIYAHSGYQLTTLYIDGSAVTVTNCTVAKSLNHGIILHASTASIRNSQFQDMADGKYAMMCMSLDAFPVLSDNTASGTGIPGVWLVRGTVSNTNKWNYPGAGISYYLDREVVVAEGAKLIVDPGVTVKSSSGWFSILGTLDSRGTAALPITYTSSSATPAAGDWYAFYFGPKAGDSTLDYVTINYAGKDNIGYFHSAYRKTAIYVDTCSPSFNHMTVAKSLNNGIEMWASACTINNSTISLCAGHGLKAESGSLPNVSNTSFIGNGSAGYYTIGTDASSVPNPVNVSFTTNVYQGVQIWGGALPASAQWKNWQTNTPYIVTSDITVNTNVTLAIEQGTTVKFQTSGLYVNGIVTANGDPSRITFSSWKDDAAGGDSNGDAAKTVASAGDWKGIYLSPNSDGSLFNNCLFRYAGQANLNYIHNAWRAVTVYVDSCSPTFSNCTISDSLNNGIELYASSAVIQNSQFSNFGSGAYPIVEDTLNCRAQLSGNTMAGTGQPGIYIPGGTLTGSNVWNLSGANFPYYLNGEVTLAEGASLNIDPGVTIKTSGQRLLIYGTLNVMGTAALPVVFTSRNDIPAPGDWLGIYFGPLAGNSVLNYMTVAYAGKENLGYWHNTYRTTAIHVDSCSPQFDHLTVLNSKWNGLELWNSNSRITGSIFRNCGSYGLKAETGSWPIIENSVIAGNGFTGNGYTAVGMDATSLPTPSGMTFTNNRMSAIQVWGGTLGASGLWKSWQTNAPYVITADTTVGNGATLSIEAGTIVKFQAYGLYVNGTLVANGDPKSILFTSFSDDSAGGDSNGDGPQTAAAAGNWKGIYLSPASGGSYLNNCVIRYAGRDNLIYIHGGYRYTALYCDDSSPTISNCTIGDSLNHGIELYSSNAKIAGCTFSNVGSTAYAVVLDTMDCFPVMSNNAGTGTGYNGIAVPGGNLGASGTWTYSGTNFPYYINGDVTIPENTSLAIEPGTLIQSGLPGLYVYGNLFAAGSPSLPIVFTSRKSIPLPGDWRGIYISQKSSSSLMKFCTVSFAGADNLGNFNGTTRRSAIYVDSGSPELANLTVFNSAAHGVTLAGSGTVLNNSLIYSNAWSGVLIFNFAFPQLVNNTIVGSMNSGIYCSAGKPLIVNNILAYNKDAAITRDGGDPDLRNNCVFGNITTNYNKLPAGIGDILVDPKFTDLANLDFHLQGSSPALNAGDNTVLRASWEDLDGRLRINGGKVDMGAYESGSAMAQHSVDALIRNGGEAVYIGGSVYALDQETKSQTVNAGVTAVYQMKVNYGGNLPDNLRVTATGAGKGWTVKYFSSLAGTNEITAAITLGGWTVTNVSPSAAIEFRAEATADVTVAGNAVQELLITSLSQGDPTQKDTVRALTTNAPKALVDLLISRANDIRYLGDNIINNDGTGQTKTREIEPGGKTIYYIRASNKGNVTDNFLVRGTGGGNGWIVRYFDALTGTNDITPLVTGAGWTNDAVPMNVSSEFRLEVTADANAPGGSTKEVLITASSLTDSTKMDSVKATTILTKPGTVPEGRTYTLDADFDDNGNATLVGLEYQTVHDQLQLDKQAVTLPFIWVPNSNGEGSLSKVDTRTGRELARYRTGKPGVGGFPTRTTVDQQGNCWVVNRDSGAVVKLGLYENGQYNDRNGNGLIETSQDANNDGDITGSEMLAWGKDECALFEVILTSGYEDTYVPGTYTGPYNGSALPRAIAVDAQGNVWAGTYNTKTYYYISGIDGQILKAVDVSAVNHTPYGAVIDSNGILWSASLDRNHVLRLNPADNTFTVIPIGHYTYGLGLDKNNHLFIAGWQNAKLSRLNILTGTLDWTVNAINEGRGVGVTANGDVWMANSAPGVVSHYSNNGVLIDQIPVGSTPTGISIDSDDKVWVVNYGDEYIHRIDPNTDQVDLTKRIIGGTHYGYSDMTGIIARTATTRFGRWTVMHNSKVSNTPWGIVSWHGLTPDGTSIKIRVRSSNDEITWSIWENAANGASLLSTPPGKFLQVETTLQLLSGNASPILNDLTVTPAGSASVGQQIYANDFQTSAGTEWSKTNLDSTPVGSRPFLGQFGNTNVSLTLSNLPPHSAVTVYFDLFIIRSWDGNNTNDGPDRFEVNVAGGLKLLNATFNNGPTNSIDKGQAFPGTSPNGSYAALTGAAETNSLGFVYPGAGVMDSVYKPSYTFVHSADTLTLNFAGSGLSTNLAEESWGLANVKVFVTPTTVAMPPQLLSKGKVNGQFKLQLTGTPQIAYEIQGSPNFVDWTALDTVTLSSPSQDWIDMESPPPARRFYRAMQK